MSLIPLWARAALVVASLGGAYFIGHHRGVASTELKHKAALADAQTARIAQYEDQLKTEGVRRAKVEADSAALNVELVEMQSELT